MRLSLGLVALLGACGLPGTSTTVPATALTTLTAGDAELVIPNGALDSDTEMVFRIVGDGKLGKDGREEQPVAPVIEILPHDVVFNEDVTLTFPLDVDETAALRTNGRLTAVDGWHIAKGDDERERPPRTRTDVDTDNGTGLVTITLRGGGYYWAAHEDIARPSLAANLGTEDRILVDVEDVEVDEETMEGAGSLNNSSDVTLYAVQLVAGSRPLSAQPGTQALAQMEPGDQLSTPLTWRCTDDGPAEAGVIVSFQWASDGGEVSLREFRAVECYEEPIIVDPGDEPDLCPEPDGEAAIDAAYTSVEDTTALYVWDEGACQTVLSEEINGIEQVWFHARPEEPVGARARGDYQLLSATLDGTPGDGPSSHPRVADVGNFAVFETQADNLVGAVEDTEVVLVKFLPDTLEPIFITRFDSNASPTTSPAVSGNGNWAAAVSDGKVRVMDLTPPVPVPVDFLDDAHSPELNKSGRYLALVTTAALNALDTDTVESVYVADRDPDEDDRYTGEPSWTLASRLPSETMPSTVELVGLSADGTQVLWIGDGSLYLTDVSAGRPATRLMSVRNDDDVASAVIEADLASDGSYAVFTTDEWSASGSLVEAWVVDTTSLAVARVSVDADGQPATDDVTEPRIAPDGEIVALQTTAILDVSDTDGGPTIYRLPNPLD